MNKIKLVALFAPAGAGKDTVLKSFCDIVNFDPWHVPSFEDLGKVHKIVSCTTRPPREKEINGIDYFFLTPQEFYDRVADYRMLEATSFRDWFYGTSIEQIQEDAINIGVFNIAGINCLLEDSRFDILPIYISASNKTRLLRQLQREENPNCDEIIRRYETDKKDFNDIEFDYKILDNNSRALGETSYDLYKMIKEYYGQK